MLTEFTEEIKAFIEAHRNEHPEMLALKIPKKLNSYSKEIINHIKALQKAKNKLPNWYHQTDIRFPSRVSMEQCSSEQTAAYKASLVSGDVCWDMTAGFGVDDYFFAQQFKEVIGCEMQKELSEIAAYNFNKMGFTNIRCLTGDSVELLKKHTNNIDCIYLDPARRAGSDQRVFLLDDCVPNILDLQEELFKKCSTILLKTAPVLDIHQACKQLKFVADVHIVAVNNECKEVLYLMRKGHTGQTNYHAVNLQEKTNNKILSAPANQEALQKLVLGEISNYLYEPNAAIMKAGFFKSICNWFPVKKLHQHSHLYSYHNLLADFPGRSFKVIATTQVQKKKIARFLSDKKANISIRNFPSSVHEIRKKLALKEGGNQYIFISTDCNDKHVAIICEKA